MQVDINEMPPMAPVTAADGDDVDVSKVTTLWTLPAELLDEPLAADKGPIYKVHHRAEASNVCGNGACEPLEAWAPWGLVPWNADAPTGWTANGTAHWNASMGAQWTNTTQGGTNATVWTNGTATAWHGTDGGMQGGGGLCAEDCAAMLNVCAPANTTDSTDPKQTRHGTIKVRGHTLRCLRCNVLCGLLCCRVCKHSCFWSMQYVLVLAVGAVVAATNVVLRCRTAPALVSASATTPRASVSSAMPARNASSVPRRTSARPGAAASQSTTCALLVPARHRPKMLRRHRSSTSKCSIVSGARA